ncbi:SDR family oxidoreductase [Paenibacillus sp. 1P07SE]|uniref:SDR family oxidoreductase n=1 Tax=Paenibacillus sp. 1P07SE TaxID=3132209 RepID=UPI0039A56D49
MKVLIIGANGKIGQLLVKQMLADKQHVPVAMVRKEEQAASFRAQGVESVLADLEAPVEEIAEAARTCDAIVFTAGSGGSTGADKTILIDLDGAVKAMEAAEQAGISRFVIVSALGAESRERWSDSIRHYHAAKHYADRILESSELIYTILRPGGLLDDPGSGRISLKTPAHEGSIPREDVAAVIAAVLDNPATYRKSYDLVSGSDSVSEALARL